MSPVMRLAIPLFSVLLIGGCTSSETDGPPAGTAAAQPAPADSSESSEATVAAREDGDSAGALPPLIDREIFFDDPELAGAQLSPDGRWVGFIKPLDGIMNIWVRAIDQPIDEARPLTDDRVRPIQTYSWSRDSRYILFRQDTGGDENFRVYAVDAAAEPAAGSRVPEARDLTPFDDIQARIVSVPRDHPDTIVVAMNDRDSALHDVYRVMLDTGERELLVQNDYGIAEWQADLEGNVRLGVRQRQDGGWEVLRADDDSFPVVYECSFEETCSPIQYAPGADQVYMATNRGQDLTRLVLFDPDTAEEMLVDEDPEGEADFGGAWFNEAGDRLLATAYVGDRLRVYPRDEEFAATYAFLQAELPDSDIRPVSRTRDDRLLLVSATTDTDPGAVWLFDTEEQTLTFQYHPRPDLPLEHLAPRRPIRYSARDGLEIQGYLTLPLGLEPRNLPLVVLPHGGPWARDTWGYDGFAQFLANRGYAVLQPNFRGSTGFGKAFLNAGNGEWGTGAMQHDITDGAQHLVDEGIADPDQVAIMGASYGGYATLAGLAFTPDLYAAGVSIVGPSNLITLLDSIPAYWGPIRRSLTLRVGDPDDSEDRERLIAQSPLYSAEEIVAPLLVVQGANDPRVLQHESDQIVAALRDLGRTVDYLVAEDEGHGFVGRENRLAMFAEIERFLATHLNGRYQTQMAGDIASRLESLRVNVDEVDPER